MELERVAERAVIGQPKTMRPPFVAESRICLRFRVYFTVAFTALSHFWPAVLMARTAKR